jgi:hypothetical protein
MLNGCLLNQEEPLLDTKYSSSTIKNIKIDTLSNSIDSVSTDYYSGVSNVYQTANVVYAVFYNKSTHSLDWLSLNDSLHSFHTILDSQGPNATGIIEGLYVHNFDSIFVNDGFNLMIINKLGKIEMKMKNTFNPNRSFRMYNYNSSNLFYNKKRKSIIGHIFFIDNSLTIETPSMAEIFIENGSFRFLHASYPQSYINQRNNLGSTICINTSYADDFVIYNFSSESNIFTYNLYTDEIKFYGGKSKLSKNKSEGLKSNSDEKKWIHYIENPKFFKVIFDPTRNVYIRLHWKEIDYHKTNSRFNTPYEKEIIMSVYSRQFELIDEFTLPPNTYLIDSEFITSIGFSINANHPKNALYDPEKHKLHAYNFEL